MTSLSLEDFLRLPAQHVSHLLASIGHLLRACPISDVAGDHVTALHNIYSGQYTIVRYNVLYCWMMDNIGLGEICSYEYTAICNFLYRCPTRILYS